MNADETLTTRCANIKEMYYIFASLDRRLSDEERAELFEKYFETHRDTISDPQKESLFVDLRPAFRKALAGITPEVRAVPKDYVPPQA